MNFYYKNCLFMLEDRCPGAAMVYSNIKLLFEGRYGKSNIQEKSVNRSDRAV